MRPWLFSQDPEDIHGRTLHWLGVAARSPWLSDVVASTLTPEDLPVHRFGLRFPNPIGLAAGMDKAGEAVPAWRSLGFGFSELGGVTRYPQPGNPKPRVFRAPVAQALVNSMGFNNPGADALAATLAAWKAAGRWPSHPVGINLGKSKITPNEDAAADYAYSFSALQDLADFFVVNVSSPNTPNLRELQDRTALAQILATLDTLNRRRPRPRPILVKVAPDLAFEALDQIIELAFESRLAGIVATNTTLTRPSTNEPVSASVFAQPGGLSGQPLAARSTAVIAHLARQTQGRIPIIGVGGIDSVEAAWEKVRAGACLLQLYTGLVYRGPSLVRDLVDGLRRRLAEEGFRCWDQAVGSGIPTAR